MWAGVAYGLYRLKGSCEDQVFGYVTLTLKECLCILITL